MLDNYIKAKTKVKISEIKKVVHGISVTYVNYLTKKQFDILREVETKLNEFTKEEDL